MMIRAITLFVLMSASALAGAAWQAPANRDADARAIRHEIERIFQAFIDKDPKALADTHIGNWRGYLTGSRTAIKGRDAYLAASVGADGMGPRGQGMIAYRILEYDTVFYGDTAVVSFVAETDARYGEQTFTTKMTLIDVYVKEKGGWIQAASQTSLHPDTQQLRMSDLRQLGEAEKAALLKAREAVWRAWFAGDEKQLRELLPRELVTLDGDGNGFGTLDTNLQGSLSFAKSGGKLRRIEFPRTDIQAYGNTAIIYTTYALESEMNGQVHKEAGRATEVFVRRGSRWLNTGWQLAPSR